MVTEQIKNDIKFFIQAFASGNLTTNALNLFQALGYVTERQAPFHKKTNEEFAETFISTEKKFDKLRARFAEWKYVDLLFQLSKEEVLKQTSLFDTKKVDSTVIETYLFFAIELSREQYSRTELSLITREVNRLFPMPAMILFRHCNTLTLSVINRRLHKKDGSKDVLEKVTLIKDISIAEPHRAHLEILYDLSFEKLKEEFEFTNFVELHNGWRDTLNIKALNDKFYKDIANWFFWACKQSEFPDDDEYYDKRETRNSENVIRLLTRIIFCWFMKEKGLIKDELFKEIEIEKLLIKDADKTGSTYYKAILQNLFFATLNIPVKSRKFISDKTFQGKSKNYFDHSVFRYKRFFKPNSAYLKFFKDIPFLNGGLFECQDYKFTTDKDKEEVIRIDCFSDNEKNEKRLKVPDEIFFSKGSQQNWLNDIFGTRNQEYFVKGIFKILNEYKFTIQENTPLEEEIALDPDLLGIVFENLLASYIPETRDTARKQTGSFYTPREIVSYMVDESLVAYFKNKFTAFSEEKIRKLLSSTEQDLKLSTSEKVKFIDAIDEIKILDPACGSGAFPMGILQKLVHLIHKLDSENVLWKKSILARTPVEIRKQTEELLKTKSADYIRKLGLIQNCIYGVDIQPIAVEISKLRFFLSLLVDFDKTDKAEDNWGIEPLPNLDFKIMQGNSLVEEFNGVSLKMKPNENRDVLNFVDDKLHEKITDLHEKQGLFLRETDPSKKKILKEDVNEKLIDIFHYQLTTIKATYFNELKKLEDIKRSIGNNAQAEKYFETEKTKADKKYGFNYLKFEKDLKQLISGKKPRTFFPYSLFFAEVFEDGGFDIVIGNPPYKVVNKISQGEYEDYSTVNSGDLYSYFFEKSIKDVLKPNGAISFITASLYIKGLKFNSLRNYLEKNINLISLKVQGDDVFDNVQMPTATFIGTKASKKIKDWSFDNFIPNNDIIKKIETDIKPLSKISDVMRGFEIGRDQVSTEGPVEFITGSDVTKWVIKKLNYISKRTETEFKKNEHFFDGERILIRETGSELTVLYLEDKLYCNRSLYSIKVKDKNYSAKYLAALLNSKLFQFYYQAKFKSDTELFPKIRIAQVNLLPIKKCSHQNTFSIIVDYILECKTERNNGIPVNSLVDSFFESLNNLLVYELYFEKEIAEAGLSVIGHLKNLKDISKLNPSSKKMEAIISEHERLNAKDHPVRNAIFNMDTIELIKTLEGKNL